jgi:hypothetical protein
MAASVDPPKQWQDWASWALGIWLILSPWILMYWTQSPAIENALVTGALLLLVEVVTLTTFRLWEEGVNVVLGLWLIVSPFILGIGGTATTTNFIIVGALVLILAVAEIRERLAAKSSQS